MSTMTSPSTPYRVMTVCTGNICRSPMAEIVLRQRFEAAGLGDLVVIDSSGISSEEHGNPVDKRARAVLAERGYPVGDGHSARQVKPSDLVSRELVLAMTAQHARALRRLGGDGNVRMYRSFDPAAPAVRTPDAEHVLDVDDPWYGGMVDFEDCLGQVEAAADGVVEFVRGELGRA